MSPDAWGLSAGPSGHLMACECDLFDLAHQYGTPLHVVNEDRLHGNLRRFKESFAGAAVEVRHYFSYKTNCVPRILKSLHDEGFGAEIASGYELWLARRLGVDPGNIVYNGVIKSRGDLEAAIASGVSINVDSATEAGVLRDVLSKSGRTVDLGIRVYPVTGWRAQFGLQPDANELMDICRRLASNGNCRITSLHTHIGTGLTSVADYRTIAESLCSLARRIQDALGTPIRHINLGGGFGVPTVKTLSMPEVAHYKLFNHPPRPPRTRACPAPEEFAAAIGAVFRRNGEKLGLMLEPGRVISSDAQVLLVTVRDIKQRSNGRRYAVTDGGLQNIAFPLSYEYHHCFVANRAISPATHRYYVTGPLCSPEDLLYRNWPLPELAIGDVLAIMDSGAYFTSFSNNFSFPRPAIVMVSNGNASVIRERETFEHMIAMDMEDDPDR
jgi:diaminopimelate decarboxylase